MRAHLLLSISIVILHAGRARATPVDDCAAIRQHDEVEAAIASAEARIAASASTLDLCLDLLDSGAAGAAAYEGAGGRGCPPVFEFPEHRLRFYPGIAGSCDLCPNELDNVDEYLAADADALARCEARLAQVAASSAGKTCRTASDIRAFGEASLAWVEQERAFADSRHAFARSGLAVCELTTIVPSCWACEGMRYGFVLPAVDHWLPSWRTQIAPWLPLLRD